MHSVTLFVSTPFQKAASGSGTWAADTFQYIWLKQEEQSQSVKKHTSLKASAYVWTHVSQNNQHMLFTLINHKFGCSESK